MGRIVDFSEWQNAIDFGKVAAKVADGTIDGVILRVQAGSTHPDARYAEYVAGCKANNIPFGTYAYFKGVSVTDAVQEAKDAVARTDKASAFIVVDIEAVTTANPTDLAAAGQAFVDYVKSQGIRCGLYTGEYFYQPHGLNTIKADFNWIAKYGVNDGQPHTAPAIPFDLWQFSSTFHIDGVAGNVDVSQYADGKDKYWLFGVQKPAEVAPKVEPTPAPVASAPVVTPRKLILPASNPTWTVYKLDHPPVKSNPANIAGVLAPAKFGGLTYDILGTSCEADVYVIHTDSFGIVKIYATTAVGAEFTGNAPLSRYPVPPYVSIAPKPQPVIHRVVSGDTLSGLAVRFGTTVASIKALNGLHSDTIYIGQSLRVK